MLTLALCSAGAVRLGFCFRSILFTSSQTLRIR